jgi:ribonucleoside-diphosphate reductase alpha chain
MEGEAYTTVSGQNSNNSVRLTDDFMRAVEADGDWQLLSRIGGKVVRTVKAREVWRAIAQASWECADPGVQFDTTINDWNTTPWSGRIEASNPCSEYMHISDSACNLSSIRLTKFFRADGVFDLSGFRQAVDVLIVAQDILVDYSSYPTEAIALGAHSFRQLGLGYADLGAVLMRLGLGYGSPTGRLLAAAITSLMTAQAYETSTRLAQTFGPFERFQENRADVLRVMEKHSDASTGLLTKLRGYPPSPHHNLIENIVQKANAVWEAAYSQAKEYGVRNAQLTLLAPTGTIGFLMDCVTTGVEPLLALVQYKNLIGGGRLKLINEDLPLTLARLGYSSEQVQSLVTYVVGHGTLSGYAGSADFINAQKILPDDWQRIEKVLRGAYDIREAFSEAVLGPALMSRLGAKADRPDWNLLEHFWGFADLRDISNYALGHGSLEGSELKDEHLPIFDTAIASAGGRCLTPEDHLLMMAAVQPFLSGAISKTCNIPESSTVEEIERLHFYAWKLGLKAVAVYRDNCKGVQAVSTRKDEKKTETTDPSPVRTDPAFKRAQRKLPKVRHGLTWALKLDGHKVYIRSGEYEDGTLGEVFVDLAKEGSTLGGLVGMWAKMVSLGLQYGVPLEELTETFTHTRFEPFGLVTNHDTIRLATSIVDLVLRVLAVHYLKRTDLQHTHPEAMDDGVIPPPTDTYTVEPDSVRKASADGPPCGTCGNLTYRNGSCYRCHSCGSTTGCS